MRTAARMGLQIIDDAEEMAGGVVKPSGRRTMQGNVKMDAPFAGVIAILGIVHRFACQGLIEVTVNSPCSLPVNDDLVEVHAFDKSSQRLAGLGGWNDTQSGTEMELADLNAVLLQRFQGVLRFLKLNR